MPTGATLNERRRARARRELEQLRTEVAAWLQRRGENDPLEQYTSQLHAVETLIDAAASALAAAIAGVKAELPLAEFADACALHELRILWLRRLWQFFRTRFDQRDDPEWEPLLKAADEVVWSTYRPVIERAQLLGLNPSQGASPLPFLEFEHSPAATPRSFIPAELSRDGLHAIFAQLPMPLVHLPASCLASPWWMVFIGHEVGHQVAADLSLLPAFQARLQAAIEEKARQLGHGDPDRSGLDWKSQASELFADAFSVVTFGVAAIRAMAEFERGPASRMAERRRNYPPAAVRLEFLASLGERLKLPDARAAVGVLPSAQEWPALAEPLALVPTAVDVSLEPLQPGGTALTDLVEFNPKDFTKEWPQVIDGMAGPRLMASAALRAWAKLMDGTQEPDVGPLGKEVVTQLSTRRIPGRRADAGPPADGSSIGAALGSHLLSLGADQLRKDEA